MSPIGAEQIAVVNFEQLTASMIAKWDRLRAESTELQDPFFASRFSAAVNQARGDVLVAVIMDANILPGTEPSKLSADRAIGFLPFHRIGRIGVPVGRFLNDAQNVVGLSADRIDWKALLKAAGVVSFDFHAISHPTVAWIETYGLETINAFRADFHGDSPGFLRQLRRDHRTIEKQGQKTRKMGREVGEVVLELDCRCPDALAQAITWKREQYQRTHILDLFLPDWTRRLVQTLNAPEFAASVAPNAQLDQEPLRGLLSVLRAGDQIVAAHFGMIENGRLHYWFPTYDPAFAKYSPGTALFTELLERCSAHGIDCIDMGYGEQPYKQKQTATTSRMAFGTITHSPWHRLRYRTEAALVSCVKQVPMKPYIKKVWRKMNPSAGIGKLR